MLTESLAPSSSAPGRAREVIESYLHAPGLERLSREAALLASELVTNAVIHAESVIDLELYVDDAQVRIAVVDYGGGTPTMRRPDEQGGGYGLHLVDELATSWGHERIAPFGKRVWFELTL